MKKSPPLINIEKVSSEFGLGDGFGQYCSFLNHCQIASDELIIIIIIKKKK